MVRLIHFISFSDDFPTFRDENCFAATLQIQNGEDRVILEITA